MTTSESDFTTETTTLSNDILTTTLEHLDDLSGESPIISYKPIVNMDDPDDFNDGLEPSELGGLGGLAGSPRMLEIQPRMPDMQPRMPGIEPRMFEIQPRTLSLPDSASDDLPPFHTFARNLPEKSARGLSNPLQSVPTVPFGILNDSQENSVKKRCRCIEKKQRKVTKVIKYIPLAPSTIQLPGEKRNFTCKCSHLRKVDKTSTIME